MTADFSLDDDLALAHRLADLAAGVSQSFFRRELRQWKKDDGSLATEADVAVETALRHALSLERPADAILGEEGGRTGESPRCWIIDGIDGTLEFAAGQPEWGTLIAFARDGQVMLGVCDAPEVRRRDWAVRGAGAFRTSPAFSGPRPLRVSNSVDLAAAHCYVPPSRYLRTPRARTIATAVAAATHPAPDCYHPALYVAAGTYGAAIFLTAGPWDLAAPALIVEEAGGRFSDLRGNHDINSGGAVFSNGAIHHQVLGVIAAGSADSGGPENAGR